jgi:hypothetical protein
MKFSTISGSLYEVDEAQRRCRRLNGIYDPTPRMGKDGEWRTYHSLYPDPIQVGQQVIIVWGDDVEAIDPNTIPVAKTTVTSPVKVINPLEN